MELLNDKHLQSRGDKIEVNKKQEVEHTLIGQFIRRRGAKLFEYDPTDQTLVEINPEPTETIDLEVLSKGSEVRIAQEKYVLNPKCIYFEALNLKTATKRVERYKNNLEKLGNLRRIGGIKIF